jgi:hypothetical protein
VAESSTRDAGVSGVTHHCHGRFIEVRRSSWPGEPVLGRAFHCNTAILLFLEQDALQQSQHAHLVSTGTSRSMSPGIANWYSIAFFRC